MRLTFGLDVLACARCGRLKHVATILDPRAAYRILEHVGARVLRRAAAQSAPVLVYRCGPVGLTSQNRGACFR